MSERYDEDGPCTCCGSADRCRCSHDGPGDSCSTHHEHEPSWGHSMPMAPQSQDGVSWVTDGWDEDEA